MNQIFTINSLKYDRSLARKWACKLIRNGDGLFEFVGVFDFEVTHSHLGIIRPGTVSYEYYWLDKWYNVFRFHEPDGSLRNYYCNINMPPVINDDRLEYVDLDIDIVVWKDLSYEVLDIDEFEENASKFDYPVEIKNRAYHSLTELENMIAERKFPFDSLRVGYDEIRDASR